MKAKKGDEVQFFSLSRKSSLDGELAVVDVVNHKACGDKDTYGITFLKNNHSVGAGEEEIFPPPQKNAK